jgi:hypothetical protein
MSNSDISDLWIPLDQKEDREDTSDDPLSSLSDAFNVVTYDWKNSGDFKNGGTWVNSFNFTAQEAGQHRSQDHYQRLVLVDISNSQCIVPDRVTHTVHLSSFNSREEIPNVLQKGEARWAAIQPDNVIKQMPS